METNIILIGMPASGKTTIGQLLSEKLDSYTFIDTDSFIEKTQGLSVAEIFKKYSEDYFRKLEYVFIFIPKYCYAMLMGQICIAS